MTKIGYPRGLLYYEYYPFWGSFFNNLDVEVISSIKTNKEILDSGIENCVDEACLPVKIFHGHVSSLRDKVDYIFIPKYVSLYKREYNCPKHLGIANMVFHSIDNLPMIISPKIVLKNSCDLKSSAHKVGKMFTKNNKKIDSAYNDAMKSYKDHTNWLRSNILPSTYCRKGNQDRIKLLILGHSYNVFDDFVNMGIIKKLCEQGVDIVLAEDVSESDKRFYSGNLSKRIFWTHGRRIVGSAFYLIENKNIDGIIYLSAFGCGLDSVLINIVENKAHENNVPIMIMTFDEQTGEAGFNTRFEAFLDMMKWRSEIEDNFSSSR